MCTYVVNINGYASLIVKAYMYIAIAIGSCKWKFVYAYVEVLSSPLQPFKQRETMILCNSLYILCQVYDTCAVTSHLFTTMYHVM